MLKIRRKRDWLLALFGVVIIGAAVVWLVASAKSDFERRYDSIKIEMTIQDVMALMEPEQPSFVGSWFVEEGQGGGYSRYEWANGGEQIVLAFQFGRLQAKRFIPLPAVEKHRRLWQRTFNSAPPF
jgi:hypothetical protein